jgi:hypothetical protein
MPKLLYQYEPTGTVCPKSHATRSVMVIIFLMWQGNMLSSFCAQWWHATVSVVWSSFFHIYCFRFNGLWYKHYAVLKGQRFNISWLFYVKSLQRPSLLKYLTNVSQLKEKFELKISEMSGVPPFCAEFSRICRTVLSCVRCRLWKLSAYVVMMKFQPEYEILI